MNRQEAIKLAKKIAGLSGRAVFMGVKAANTITKVGYEVADAGLSTAKSLADEFSGSSSPTPALNLAKKGTKTIFNKVDKFAEWGYKKSKELGR